MQIYVYVYYYDRKQLIMKNRNSVIVHNYGLAQLFAKRREECIN